jgi:hypothetical protein
MDQTKKPSPPVVAVKVSRFYTGTGSFERIDDPRDLL